MTLKHNTDKKDLDIKIIEIYEQVACMVLTPYEARKKFLELIHDLLLQSRKEWIKRVKKLDTCSWTINGMSGEGDERMSKVWIRKFEVLSLLEEKGEV